MTIFSVSVTTMQNSDPLLKSVEKVFFIQTCIPEFTINRKKCKYKNPVILSFFKGNVHIFNMSIAFRHIFRSIAYKLRKKLIIQTCHSVFAITREIS